MRELFDGCRERAFRSEGAEVQLVDQAERRRLEIAVRPGEGAVVDTAGRAMHALGLPLGARVGKGLAAIEGVGVFLHAREACFPPASFRLERVAAGAGDE